MDVYFIDSLRDAYNELSIELRVIGFLKTADIYVSQQVRIKNDDVVIVALRKVFFGLHFQKVPTLVKSFFKFDVS